MEKTRGVELYRIRKGKRWEMTGGKNVGETRGTGKRRRYKGGREREGTAMTRQSEPENDDEEQREGR